MRKALKCIMIILGTLIGAGFASGKEIVSFFNKFSNLGIIGIILSSVLFGIVVFVTMMISKKIDASEFKELVNNNRLVITTIKAFSFVCFCIMLSGIGTYLDKQYSINFWYGTIFFGVLCFVFFLLKFDGLEKINYVLVPIILLGIVLVNFKNNNGTDYMTIEYTYKNTHNLLSNWFQASLLYTGYNSILLLPILLEMKNYSFSKKEIVYISCAVTLLICSIALLMYFALNHYYPDIIYAEMPILLITKNINNIVSQYYGIIVVLAIFTTAFSAGYVFLRLNKEKHYLRNSVLMCVSGIVFAKIGFSNLVDICFPIFGYMGILQIFYIIWNVKKSRKLK